MTFKKIDTTPRNIKKDSFNNRTQINQPPSIPKPQSSPPPQKSNNTNTSTSKKEGK